jgi:hypothetical protein
MTVSATLLGTLLHGVAASRPAANAVAGGTIYSATDTGAITQSDGSSWATFATISSGLADPMTTRGDIIVRNASNVTARLAIGSSGKVLSSDGTDISWQTPAGASGMLASHVYAPSTQTVYSTSSSTMADVDATNMAVTFTAPASGNVRVVLSAWGDLATADFYHWGLRESTTNLAVVTVVRGGGQGYIYVPIYLTGISAGSHTYKWSHGTDGTGGQNGRILIKDNANTSAYWGPGIMEVWSV